MNRPELSIVVPVLNEAGTLPALFATLAGQRQVAFEVILSDGGSTDGTAELGRQLAGEARCICTVVAGERGRGRQLNVGAQMARGETLLFLHADSQFDDALALRHSLDALNAAIGTGDERVAGHCALRFRRCDDQPSLAYRYYEEKARLDRPGCTHGDQGFLLRRTFFDAIGPFDETLSVLEDTRFAERVRSGGRWLLLPAEIWTSARRFEVEGLRARQTLNALIMNFAAVCWHPFFREAPGLYRQQDRAGDLQLTPFLHTIRRLLGDLPLRRRLTLWYRTGTYVRGQAWQLAFCLDVRRSFHADLPLGMVDTPALAVCDRWFDRFTDHPPGRLFAALLVWCWFHGCLVRGWLLSRSKGVLQ